MVKNRGGETGNYEEHSIRTLEGEPKSGENNAQAWKAGYKIQGALSERIKWKGDRSKEV